MLLLAAATARFLCDRSAVSRHVALRGPASRPTPSLHARGRSRAHNLIWRARDQPTNPPHRDRLTNRPGATDRPSDGPSSRPVAKLRPTLLPRRGEGWLVSKRSRAHADAGCAPRVKYRVSLEEAAAEVAAEAAAEAETTEAAAAEAAAEAAVAAAAAAARDAAAGEKVSAEGRRRSVIPLSDPALSRRRERRGERIKTATVGVAADRSNRRAL